MKKRRSTKSGLESKTEEKKKDAPKGPYRNIPESKKHQVSGFPDIIIEPISSKIEFIIVACDGIWDCYTNEEAMKYIRKKKE